MKKKIIILVFILVVLIIGLVACSKTSSTISSTTSLSETENLMVGIIKLDETAQVVTSTQATTLLPLWQAYQSLMNSSTSSQTEKDALIKQISANLTSEQLSAINALQLTQSDVQTLFSSTGFNPTYEGTQTASTPSAALQGAASGSSSSTSGRGDGPGGGVPPGDGAGPGGDVTGGGLDSSGIPSTNATPDGSAKATAQTNRSANLSNPMIYNLIIRYLQSKITSN